MEQTVTLPEFKFDEMFIDLKDVPFLQRFKIYFMKEHVMIVSKKDTFETWVVLFIPTKYGNVYVDSWDIEWEMGI